MASDAGAHYLRPAGRTQTPPAVVVLDSETRQHDDGSNEVHTLRCWDARITWRRDRRRAGETRHEAGQDAASAAAAIDAWASYGETTWLYAHNVAFDLVVTNLAAELAELGWELSSRHGLSADGMWCVLHKGRATQARRDKTRSSPPGSTRVKWRHTLTIADTASIWPAKLAELAPLTGIVKPPLPDADDSAAAWAARCSADTAITMALVLTLMDWWDEHDMGQWAVTGAGLGWQSYRRTLAPRQLVIDHDPASIAWERQAVYGGRRDVFRAGHLTPGRWAEVDYEAAHLAIAEHCLLPAKTACPVADTHRRAALRGRVPAGMIAEVTIRTSTPRWPCRVGGRVFYPVGEFRTVLAAPDIQSAADAGALVDVHDGQLYVMTGHLRPWARQCREWCEDRSTGPAAIVATAAKLWYRAVIGKFAQKGWRTVAWMGPPSTSWTVEPTSDLYDGTRGVVTGLCGQYWLSWADQRGEHERPAVLAFVEAHVRSRLGAVIAGPYGSAIAQCDTDGVLVAMHELSGLAAAGGRKWVHGEGRPLDAGDVIAEWSRVSWPLVMREKQAHRRVRVFGPQHLVLDDKARMSGVPRGAWQTSETSWAARAWPGITWQSAHGPPGGYARPVLPFTVARPYAAGWVLADGSVSPVELSLDPDGSNRLHSWPETALAVTGARLAPLQARWADGLWGCDEQSSVA